MIIDQLAQGNRDSREERLHETIWEMEKISGTYAQPDSVYFRIVRNDGVGG